MFPIFDRDTAFCRNLGWLSAPEQDTLRTARIAIAGLGGVGGSHLLTLTRLGVGKFNISDYDHFELHNLNRQAGATMSTLGQAKVEVLARMARDINPELDLRTVSGGGDGSQPAGLPRRCRRLRRRHRLLRHGRPAHGFRSLPRARHPGRDRSAVGDGGRLPLFRAQGDELRRVFPAGGTAARRAARALHRWAFAGDAPAELSCRALGGEFHRGARVHRRPWPATCVPAWRRTEVLKILLRRGRIRAAPRGFQFDAYRQKFVHTSRPLGNAGPRQRLLLAAIRRKLRG